MIIDEKIIEGAKNKILLPERYMAPSGGFPHIYKFENKDKKILFFAADHTPTSKKEQFNKIRDNFISFSPDIVFVEGFSHLNDPKYSQEIMIYDKKIKNKTWDDILKNQGERTFTYKLCLENNIPVISSEYTEEQEATILKKVGFSDSDLFLFYGSRMAMNFAYEKRDEVLDSYLNRYFEGVKQELWKNEYDYSFNHFIKVVKENFGDSVDIETGEGFKEKCNPNPPTQNSKRKWYKTNEMSAILSRKRDEKILEKIAEVLENHDRLFIVYGGSHGVMLEPAISYLIQNL